MPRNCAPQHDLCNSTCLQGTRCLQVSFAMQHMQCCGESAVSSFPTVFFAYSHFRFSFTSFALRSLLWLLGMSVSPLPPPFVFFFFLVFFFVHFIWPFYLTLLVSPVFHFSFFSLLLLLLLLLLLPWWGISRNYFGGFFFFFFLIPLAAFYFCPFYFSHCKR